jgi:hypothetical protein
VTRAPLSFLPPVKIARFADGRGPRGDAPVERVLAPLADRAEPEAYRLVVDAETVRIQSATPAGIFYGEQTLAQLRAAGAMGAGGGRGLPRVDILDWPDFATRGFYHDVTRGKVPTLATLLELAETCASLKLNQLQLYVEHTFAFRRHPEIWRGADPLSAEDILALDARCAELHIELVPSFSTFGHCYGWIHDKFPGLNELERDVSADPFCWWDRMMHHTLDPLDPGSLALVREIIAETRPLFRSRLYNICCDETFDLGRGKNREAAERGEKGRLYLDFLLKIMAVVREHDATPLFWGDIIGHHPELVNEVPKEAICLDWDYSPELADSKSALFRDAGRTFYVCPGVNAWNRWLPDYARARGNILALARRGLDHGAKGLLLTDWGDYGHINTLGPALGPLALGAAAAWHARSPLLGEAEFDRTVSRRLLGDPAGRLQGLLDKASTAARASWQALCLGVQPRSHDMPDDWFEPRTGLARSFFVWPAAEHRRARAKLLRLAPRVEAALARLPDDAVLAAEVRVALRAMIAMESVWLHFAHLAGVSARRGPVAARVLADELSELKEKLRAVWLARNRASEFYRVADLLDEVARRVLNGAGAVGRP